MKISIVVAVANNGVVGNKGQLPWRLSADLQHFKQLTLGKTVLMGRKTFESIGRALPQRQNWVISSQTEYALPEGVKLFTGLEAALAQAQAEKLDELCVIGGGEIYRQLLPLATVVYLTKVNASPEGDTFFPELVPEDWAIAAKTTYLKDEKNDHDFEIIQLVRNGVQRNDSLG